MNTRKANWEQVDRNRVDRKMGFRLNLKNGVERIEPRMTRMTRMRTMVENLLRGHPPGEHPLPRNPFFIRAIREIRGSNCFF